MVILKLGEEMMKRDGHDKEQYSFIRTQLRELGRLLKELGILWETSESEIETFIDPTLFQTVINATRVVSGVLKQPTASKHHHWH